MKVLLIGSGAREHCLAQALVAGGSELYAFMQTKNPSIMKLARGYALGKANDVEVAAAFAKEKGVELAIIGPEAPLAAGIVDVLHLQNIPCVGPTKEMAQLETSKGFTRQIMQKYGIPGLPKFKVFSKITGISQFMDEVKDFVEIGRASCRERV